MVVVKKKEKKVVGKPKGQKGTKGVKEEEDESVWPETEESEVVFPEEEETEEFEGESDF